MQRLDEATAAAAALGGDAEIVVCVAWARCYLIAACEQVRDDDRAGEWCGRVAELCESNGIALPLSVCKAKYARVLLAGPLGGGRGNSTRVSGTGTCCLHNDPGGS